jgi:acyl-CoA thioester hydrolase
MAQLVMQASTSDENIPLPYPGKSRVRVEWEDANGHMNMAHYVSAFDDGSCPMFDYLGLGWGYTRAGKGSIFVASSNIDYKRELLAGDGLSIGTVLLGFDNRRIQIYQELYHETENYLAAQAEFMFVHVSLLTRKMIDIPKQASIKLKAVYDCHKNHKEISFVGRTISLR